MSTCVTFYVDGQPIPQGSKSIMRAGAKAWLVDANAKKLKLWRQKIVAAVREKHTEQLFDAGVEVWATFYLPRPKSVKRLLPWVKPDVDKLARALFDGITDSGLWADDSRVVDAHLMKRYADSPGVFVIITDALEES